MNFKLLKKRDFALLMFGKFTSLTGTQMQDFALSLYVFNKTGSATLFASVIIVALIPQIVLTPFCGVLSDMLDRKKTIVNLDMISGFITVVFGTLFIKNGGLPLYQIYLMVILLAIVSALYQPSSATIIPSIIERKDFMSANSISSVVTNIGNLISPIIAGFIYAIWGLFVMIFINAISFFLTAIAEMFINIPKVKNKNKKINLKSFGTELKEGILFIRNRREIVNLILLAPIINFVFSPLFSTGIITITKKVLKVSNSQYGIIEMVLVGAMLISPYITAKFYKNVPLGRVLYIDVLISSILIGIMAIVPSKSFLSLFTNNSIPIIVLLILGSLCTMVITTVNIALGTMFQKIVPLPMIGRVSSVMNTICLISIPLGQLLFGRLFDKLNSSICILISCGILLASVLVFRKSLLSTKDGHQTSNLTFESISD